jgi:hypothetical protein
LSVEPVSLTPGVLFVPHRMEADIRPAIVFQGDQSGHEFQQRASLRVRDMLYMLTGSQGSYSHLLVNVRSPYFPEHKNAMWSVTASMRGETLGKARFVSFYAQHQFVLPLSCFWAGENVLELTAEAIDADPDGNAPTFVVDVDFCNQAEIWDQLEKSSVWVFSTARSGSTWLAGDILASRRLKSIARVVDESGIGRMFAPLSWDFERTWNLAARPFYIESGPAYESGQVQRTHRPGMPPPFERAFTDMHRDLQILNRVNYDFYHTSLRETALRHVLNEWGVRGYERLVFKMPNDSHCADHIMRAFPRSRMIMLVRDGRDVMRSRFSPFASGVLSATKDAELRRQAVAYYSHFWNFQVDIIRAAYEAHDPKLRYMVRYEDLREDPRWGVEEILSFTGLSLDEGALELVVKEITLENMPAEMRGPDKPRQTGRVGGYRDLFSADEIELMNEIMGDNLERFGYHRDAG